MAFCGDERKLQLTELQSFLSSCSTKIANISDKLGWSKNIGKVQELVHCPLKEEHRVPEATLSDHIARCRWKQEGYTEEDLPLSEPAAGSSRTATQSILMAWRGVQDDRPVPRTVDRYLSNFTVDERRAKYDYIVSKTASVSAVKIEDLTSILAHPYFLPSRPERCVNHSADPCPRRFHKVDRPRAKTKLERLAEERDAKRKRVSERSRKVHTNRKSRTEILREVIMNQMELYEEWVKHTSENDPTEDFESRLDPPADKMNGRREDGATGLKDEGNDVKEYEGENLEKGRLCPGLLRPLRAESPWRSIEKEGLNPYKKDSWDAVREKNARRLEQLQERYRRQNESHSDRYGSSRSGGSRREKSPLSHDRRRPEYRSETEMHHKREKEERKKCHRSDSASKPDKYRHSDERSNRHRRYGYDDEPRRRVHDGEMDQRTNIDRSEYDGSEERDDRESRRGSRHRHRRDDDGDDKKRHKERRRSRERVTGSGRKSRREDSSNRRQGPRFGEEIVLELLDTKTETRGRKNRSSGFFDRQRELERAPSVFLETPSGVGVKSRAKSLSGDSESSEDEKCIKSSIKKEPKTHR
uniref:CHHC U11-48K-type domain-containing protein n=1 Tax=Timema tahoe TaxID=61484 RepID=A0A7R9IK85_9NEOP|nr:unnamed protein product [Timema tahoe]